MLRSRGEIEQAKDRNPTAEMIQDAKENGIDLNDSNVQEMLARLQDEKVASTSHGHLANSFNVDLN